MPLLDTFKAAQQSFERIFPRAAALDAHPQRMDGFVEAAFPSALRGLAVAGILCDIGDQAGIEHALPIVRGIKTAIKVEVGTSEVQPALLEAPCFKAFRLWGRSTISVSLPGATGAGATT
jgi:hypothetical protein